MNEMAFHENLRRGSHAFPASFYRVSAEHPRYEMPLHWHMEEELIWVEEGQLTLWIDQEQILLSEGEAALVAGGALHSGKPRDCIYHCLVFDNGLLFPRIPGGEEAKALLEHRIEPRQPFLKESGPARRAKEIFTQWHTLREEREFMAIGSLWQFWGSILAEGLYDRPLYAEQKSHRKREAVKNALRRIHMDYARPLTLGELAEEARMNPHYFCSVFREAVGQTPVKYLCNFRLEVAAERLRSTRETVTDIALESGFGDLSYFTKAFTKKMGQSPGSYRRASGE
ncbi:MAG: AraC family transcriptional regulator [Clostridia bacterium]|nr:AraC family transcriptional regulator [Clostridia bacterium]